MADELENWVTDIGRAVGLVPGGSSKSITPPTSSNGEDKVWNNDEQCWEDDD